MLNYVLTFQYSFKELCLMLEIIFNKDYLKT